MTNHHSSVLHQFRKYVRFRLRTILLLIAILCAVLWWGRERYLGAMRLRHAVALIRSGPTATFAIRYEHEREPTTRVGPYITSFGEKMISEPLAPRWMRSILGDEYFVRPMTVELAGEDVIEQLEVIVEGMPWLRSVTIIGRVPAQRQAKHLHKLRELTSVSIRESYTVADNALVVISRIEALRRLELTDCFEPVYRALEDLDPAETKITELKLGGTDLTDDALKCLPLLPSLRSLELQNCYLTNESIPFLAQWSFLERLQLEHTALPPDRIDELRAALPGTAITYVDDGVRK